MEEKNMRLVYTISKVILLLAKYHLKREVLLKLSKNIRVGGGRVLQKENKDSSPLTSCLLINLLYPPSPYCNIILFILLFLVFIIMTSNATFDRLLVSKTTFCLSKKRNQKNITTKALEILLK